jgi:antitoxin component YwqK of YwqJK toxin-antitoxin module
MRVFSVLRAALSVGCLMACLLVLGGCGDGDGEQASQHDGRQATIDGEATGDGVDSSTADDDLGISEADLIVQSPGGDAGEDKPLDTVEEDLVIPAKLLEVRPFKELYEDRSLKKEWSAKVYSDETRINHGPYVEYHPGGVVKFCEGKYDDGRRDGEWVFQHVTGKTAKRGKYNQGKPSGTWTVYREDGTKLREESYNDGKRDGPWVVFADDGTSPLRKMEYRADQLHGQSTTWYEPGKKAVESRYKNGVLDGKRTRWYRNGNKASEENFKDGKRHGQFIAWNDTGAKINEIEYVNDQRVSKKSG